MSFKEAVKLGSRYPLVALFMGLLCELKQLRHAKPAFGGDEDYWRVCGELHHIAYALFIRLHRMSILLNRVPLVDGDDEARARFVSIAADRGVERGRAFYCVNQEDR